MDYLVGRIAVFGVRKLTLPDGRFGIPAVDPKADRDVFEKRL
jgi:hypothetical protein